MPGISANLTAQAYAIWETMPKKEKGNPERPGRSFLLSQVIIGEQAWASRHDAVLKEKFELEDKLRLMTEARDRLQEIVLELPE